MSSSDTAAATFSVEISTPRTAQAAAALPGEIRGLALLRPRYVSVTCGPGAAARGATLDLVEALRRESDLDVVPHVTCIGASRAEIRALLAVYAAVGVHRVLAVRGDLPPGEAPRDFQHASDLVAFIRSETGERFHVEVAAHPEFHPEAPSARADLERFKRKVDAGASSATTQYFYNADAYLRFVESCTKLGVVVPIVPGVMPITNREWLLRFSNANGVEIPRWIRKRLEDFGPDVEGLRAFGVDVVERLCRTLLAGGAPGLHFYTLGHAEPTATIWRGLGLPAGGARAPARDGYDPRMPMVDEQKKAELEQHLSTLRTEVEHLARTDAEGAKSVAGFAELSAHEATRSRPNAERLRLALAGLQHSVQEFEKTHPRLVEIVGSLSKTLSNVGL